MRVPNYLVGFLSSFFFCCVFCLFFFCSFSLPFRLLRRDLPPPATVSLTLEVIDANDVPPTRQLRKVEKSSSGICTTHRRHLPESQCARGSRWYRPSAAASGAPSGDQAAIKLTGCVISRIDGLPRYAPPNRSKRNDLGSFRAPAQMRPALLKTSDSTSVNRKLILNACSPCEIDSVRSGENAQH